MCDVRIEPKDLKQLQINLLRSHAVGVGDALPEEVIRALMVIRINTLVQGNSGVRLELVQLLIDCLNKKIHPCVPAQGSVGASGDLAPLAHMALPLIGEGEVIYEGNKMNGAQALEKAGLKPVVLESKKDWR